MDILSVKAWFDNSLVEQQLDRSQHINWIRCIPFILLHLSLLMGLFLPISTAGVVLCLVSYLIRMFAITGFYHRYFSHKTFRTSKYVETFFALLGTASAQRGPIWWAAHHRAHHKHSDTSHDEHTPHHKGFLRSHMLWFMSNKNFHVGREYVKDLLKKQHLVLIDRFDGVIPLLYLLIMAAIGFVCQHYTAIELTPLTAMYWGFSVSTVLLLHATFAINSVGHTIGKKVYQTGDDSRNNWFLAIITLGEGWHNNHHHWPISARQGFHWAQIDISYYILLLLKRMKLISAIINVPQAKINENKLCALQS